MRSIAAGWCGGRDGDIYMANRLQEELARLGVCMLPRTPHPDLSLSVVHSQSLSTITVGIIIRGRVRGGNFFLSLSLSLSLS
eukprot:COSAG06_NODE_889_length_11746_cov_48.163733_11_plen_82_part_00